MCSVMGRLRRLAEYINNEPYSGIGGYYKIHKADGEQIKSSDVLVSIVDLVDYASYLRQTEINDIEAENSKLRELAAGLLRCLSHKRCATCPLCKDEGSVRWCNRFEIAYGLGIEVER